MMALTVMAADLADRLLDAELPYSGAGATPCLLPPGYRAVFLLHDVEGYEHNEIADMLGCSIGNSKSQLHKARTRLRDLLQEAERDHAREVRQEAKRDLDDPASPEPETRPARQGS